MAWPEGGEVLSEPLSVQLTHFAVSAGSGRESVFEVWSQNGFRIELSSVNALGPAKCGGRPNPQRSGGHKRLDPAACIPAYSEIPKISSTAPNIDTTGLLALETN